MATLGAYGFRITGIPGAERLLVRADPEWPSLEIVLRHGRSDEEPRMDDETAVLPFADRGLGVVDRRRGRAVFTLPRSTTSDEIVHPYLAPAAAAMSYWLGRESFHAGAFLGPSGAWALLAGREGGKSSTLAQLSRSGMPIVCDDVLVLERTTGYAGPRALDLRREAAEALGVGDALGVVGTRERWRVPLGAIDGAVPLRGWILLSWGESLSMDPLPVKERIGRLAGHRAVMLAPRDPGLLLELSALPAFELTRPREWSSLEGVVEAIASLS